MDNELNRVIDEAARRLTQGETGAAFTVRVLARLDDRHPRAGWWRSPWMLSPLAAAAAIAIVFVVARPPQTNHTQTETQEPASQERSATASGQSAQVAADRTPGVEKSLTLRTGRVHLNVAAGDPETGFPEASEIDALAPPLLASPPLAVDSIRLTAIPPADSIAVSQLEPVAPIAVAPIQ